MGEALQQATTIRDEDERGSNVSGNPHIQELIDARVSRRRFLGGTVAVAATSFLGGIAVEPLAAHGGGGRGPHGRLGFLEVPPSTDDAIVVPPGYACDVLAPWGTPLLPGAPYFHEDASNTAAEQALQVGFNHDGIHYFPLPRFGNSRGLLVVNHEYTDANQIYTAVQGSTITPDTQGREKVAKALAAHGVSVIAIRKNTDGTWSIVPDEPYNRRITGTTPMAFSGPVRANHPMLQSAITPTPSAR